MIDNTQEQEEFWDFSLDMSEEELAEIEKKSKSKEEDDDEEQEIENEEILDDDESQEDEELDESEEEDDVIKTGYEVFKDSIFKYLPEDYKFKATEKGFEEAVTKVEETLFESIHSQYLQKFETNPKATEYLNFIVETNGKGDIDKWVDINLKNNYSDEDLTDETIQKKVITEYYKLTGIEDEDIEDKLNDLEDLNKLEKESKLALKYINKYKETSTDELINDVKVTETKLKEVYDNNKQVLTSLLTESKIPSVRKQKIVEEILEPVKLQNGSEMTMLDYRINVIKSNPEHIIQFANFLLNYDPNTGFDVKNIVSKTENTKTTKSLRSKLEEVERNSTMTKSKSNTSYRGKTEKDIDLSSVSFITN